MMWHLVYDGVDACLSVLQRGRDGDAGHAEKDPHLQQGVSGPQGALLLQSMQQRIEAVDHCCGKSLQKRLVTAICPVCCEKSLPNQRFHAP